MILYTLIGLMAVGGFPTGVMAEHYKLVVQMSSYDERAQKRTLVRINQLLNAMKGEKITVEVVAIGPAFNLVAKNAEKKLLSLASRFNALGNLRPKTETFVLHCLLFLKIAVQGYNMCNFYTHTYINSI